MEETQTNISKDYEAQLKNNNKNVRSLKRIRVVESNCTENIKGGPLVKVRTTHYNTVIPVQDCRQTTRQTPP